jgi:hypothetical protein
LTDMQQPVLLATMGVRAALPINRRVKDQF